MILWISHFICFKQFEQRQLGNISGLPFVQLPIGCESHQLLENYIILIIKIINSTKLKLLFNFIENLLHEFDPLTLNSTKIQASELHRTTAHSPVLVKFLSLNHFKFHRLKISVLLTTSEASSRHPRFRLLSRSLSWLLLHHRRIADSLNKIEQEKLSSRTFVKHIESSIKSSPKSRRTWNELISIRKPNEHHKKHSNTVRRPYESHTTIRKPYEHHSNTIRKTLQKHWKSESQSKANTSHLIHERDLLHSISSNCPAVRRHFMSKL